MIKSQLTIILLFWLTFAVTAKADTDRFDLLMERLNNAGCLSMQFLSIIESKVFDDVDSSSGELYLSSDGRFLFEIETDQYLFDGSQVYTFSVATNQVIIETPPDSATASREFSFLLMLDRLYTVEPISVNKSYRLVIKNASSENYPDSMVVVIDQSDQILKRLEYYDINDDLNIIDVIMMQLADSCSTDRFVPSFPDSAERVKL